VVRDDRVVAEPANEDFPATELQLWEAKLDNTNLHLARATEPIADNYVLADEELAVHELAAFKSAGGGAVLDVTSIGLKRDPLAVRRVAQRTGLHIVLGTGYYQRVYHPDDMDSRSVDDLTRTIVREIEVGILDGRQQTDVRAGLIGEIGINGGPLITNELKSMRAAARASRLTGAGIVIHLGGVGAEKHTILDIVEDEGVDLERVCVGHCDSIANDTPFMLELLARGVFVAFDTLGQNPTVVDPSLDAVVAAAIPRFVEAGYADRILLSQDVCWKVGLRAFGGPGYAHIQESFVPRLAAAGVAAADIDHFIRRNPARLVTFGAPGA
jgi:phosphotriesterase-related protein